MFSYDMVNRDGQTLYEHLYRCIRHDIAHGAVPAGRKLPSKRALAEHLGVSLVTVEAAYRQLIAEGYVISRERSGYFVCELAPVEKIGLLSDGLPSDARVAADGSALGSRASDSGLSSDSRGEWRWADGR